MPQQNDVRKCMQKIDKLVSEIETLADPDHRKRSIELVSLLMEMHGTGIDRMLTLIRHSDGSGEAIIDAFGADPLIGSLLMLYGFHPVGLRARVHLALDKVRPYLTTHHGNVELVDIDDQGIVTLRLQGSCHGCPSSEMTLKNAIEEAIYEFAPDIGGLHVEGVVQQSSSPRELIQISAAPVYSA